ncbi:hypothetical protein FNF28_02316 [Cafeteria roenbergensis]|uniref:TmcB/TmcC TPR repeats domain-containing protein n=1 Tax=Cafeteria roenbergensis TaxID=33653 RepID=A0A5A8DZS9_CAFRO|nr:hypothetical protein FNF28_02316 [Cafeteria roenbergensis]
MLAFPFSAVQTVWQGTIIRSAALPVLTVVMPASLDLWFGPAAYQVMFFLGIAWVLIFISLSVSIAVAFIREKKQSEFALRLFRGVAVLSTTVLFLPVSSLLFRSYSCSAGSDISGSTDDWLGAGIPCDNVWRMVVLGVVAVMLLLFFILAMFVAATFVNRHPGSLRWAAKSHGRVAIALLVAKVLLTAIFNVSPAAARSLGTCIALIVVALGWLVALYRELPMLRPVANALRAGSATAFLWASVALLVSNLMPGHDVSVMTLLGIPVAALAGGMLVLTEARRVVSGKLSDCVSVSHIVLWASARVQEAEQIQHKAEGTPVAIAIDRLASAFSLKYIEQTENYTDDSLEADEARVLGSARHRGGPGPWQAAAVSVGEEAYRTAMKSEASGLALVAAAKFYEAFSPHKQQEVDCIGKLKAMQPAPDLAFVVFVRGIELSDSTAAEGGLAPIDRVMFEQMSNETRALRTTALRSMVELWAHLEQKRPDLWQVLQTGARLDADIVRCDFLFSRMLRLNPESTTILRAYSGFLSGLGFDPVRGMELRNRADRIDEVASRSRVGKVASVSLFSYGASLKGNRQLQLALTDASSPVVTISTSSSNRGEIVAVTPAAAKLLLATRADSLIGQNISTIVPPPFQDFHQHMLDGFGRSVTSESSIVGHEVMLPVARRDGTIIACNLTFDESPPDAATMQPRLAAVLHPVPSAHDLVLFVKPDKRGIARVRVAPMLSLKETGLVPLEFQGAPFATVLAGSVQCMRMMGSEVFLLRFVPTRLVIPAGVPLDGSEAELVMEDSPEAGSRPSMAIFGGVAGPESRKPSAVAFGATRTQVKESDNDDDDDGESVSSAGVVLSQADSAGHEKRSTPRADVLLPSSQAGNLERGQESSESATLIRSATGDNPGHSESVAEDAKLLHRSDSADAEATCVSMTDLLNPKASGVRDRRPSPSDTDSSRPEQRRTLDPENLTVSAGASKSGLSLKVLEPRTLPAAKERASRPLKGALKQPGSAVGMGGARMSVGASDFASSSLGEGKIVSGPSGTMFGDGASSTGDSTVGGAAQVGGLLRAVLNRNEGREGETNSIRLVLLLSATCVLLASAGTAIWIDRSRVTMEGRSEGFRLSTVRMHAFHEAWTTAVSIFTNVSRASDIVLAPVDVLHDRFVAAADRSHDAAKLLHDAGEAAGPHGANFDLEYHFPMLEPSPDGKTPPVVSQMSVGDAETFIYGIFGVLKALPPTRVDVHSRGAGRSRPW